MDESKMALEFPVSFVLSITGVVVAALPFIDAFFRPLPTVTSFLIGLTLCVIAVRMRGEDRRVAWVCLMAVGLIGIFYLTAVVETALRA